MFEIKINIRKFIVKFLDEKLEKVVKATKKILAK